MYLKIRYSVLLHGMHLAWIKKDRITELVMHTVQCIRILNNLKNARVIGYFFVAKKGEIWYNIHNYYIKSIKI